MTAKAKKKVPAKAAKPAGKGFIEIYTKKRGTDVVAEYYSGDKVVIRAGSKLSKDVIASYRLGPGRGKELNGKARESGDHLVLRQDMEFTSVSGALNYATGGNMNGWDQWLIKKTDAPLRTIKKK